MLVEQSSSSGMFTYKNLIRIAYDTVIIFYSPGDIEE